MSLVNQSLFHISFKWDRANFEASRQQCRVARQRIAASINIQLEKEMRSVFSKNIHIEQSMHEIDERLLKHEDKLRILDNMIDLASQSLSIYFEKRMETAHALIAEHCRMIQQILHEEAEHWKEIHAVMDQNLLNPGDIRSRNNYPKSVLKSPAPNIDAIDEVDEEEISERHMSELMNGKTLTPLLTQLIRKSRLESKTSISISSSRVKVIVPISYENSIPRKREKLSVQIRPMNSSARQILDFVDTTFVVKPEEMMLIGDMNHDADDEANGTYRAAKSHYRSQGLSNYPETSLLDSQPNIPARLCFSPTFIQDGTVLPDEANDEESSTKKNDESTDQHRSSVEQIQQDIRRFGQTFLLETIKSEKNGTNKPVFKRPAIPDDDDEIQVIFEGNPVRSTSNEPTAKPQRGRITKNKAKTVVISARKTRSVTKEQLERAVTTVTMKTAIEPKRKIRKRKPSKSTDRAAESSDDEDEKPTTSNTARKTKKRKKSNGDRQQRDQSEEEINTKRKRSKSKTNERQRRQTEEVVERRPTRKTRSSTKPRERERSYHEEKAKDSSRQRKKSKVTTETTKRKKSKTKKSSKDDDDEETASRSDQSRRYNTRSSAKRDRRPVR